MKFRKKPITVDAIRVSSLLLSASHARMDTLPDWVSDAYYGGKIAVICEQVQVRTLEGVMVGYKDDWLIRGIKGELYPCNSVIFSETYEAVTQ